MPYDSNKEAYFFNGKNISVKEGFYIIILQTSSKKNPAITTDIV
jgi:hypothetical protein